MPEFRFISTWVVDAPATRVFDALHDYERWPQWWPGAEQMQELEPTGPDGLGGRALYVWRSRLGYRLRFTGTATRIERPHLLAGRVDGDLAGTGTWQLFERAGQPTTAVYVWRVRTTSPWTGALARLLHRVLVANHDHLMDAGARGLAEHLGARLVASR